MGEDTDYIVSNAPSGATHWGKYKTGKIFYALEFYNQSKSKLDYLEWFPVQNKFYSVADNDDKLTPLK